VTPSPLYEEDVYSPLDRKRTSLVGLHGHAQSGKNTSGDILTEEFGYEQISFAEPLKRLALFVNPVVKVAPGYGITWTLQDIFDDLADEGITGDDAWEEAKKIGSTRRFLQKLGEGVREILGENTWVDYAMAKVEEGGKYAFTDTRFENEAQAILDRMGMVVEIKRPGVGPVNDHVSDQRLPDEMINLTVLNGGTIDDLRKELRVVGRLAA
jgi:hypothetical protein